MPEIAGSLSRTFEAQALGLLIDVLVGRRTAGSHRDREQRQNSVAITITETAQTQTEGKNNGHVGNCSHSLRAVP